MWDPQQAFETSLKYDDHLITRETRASLLDGWARQDPEGLYTKAASFPIDYRNTAVVAALGQMASDAPEEAVRLASELETSMLKAAAKGEILEHWSSKDAKSAVEWFVEDSVDESAEKPVRDLIYAFQSYMRQDFDAARNYVDQYDGKLKSWFVEAIAHHLARFDAERAIEYLPNVDEESRDWIVSTIGYELVRLDPSKALAFGETIKASRKDEYYRDMLFSWANYDLMALYRNLQKVPYDYRAVAATKLLNENETKHFLSEREIQKLEPMVSNDNTLNQSDL